MLRAKDLFLSGVSQQETSTLHFKAAKTGPHVHVIFRFLLLSFSPCCSFTKRNVHVFCPSCPQIWCALVRRQAGIFNLWYQRDVQGLPLFLDDELHWSAVHYTYGFSVSGQWQLPAIWLVLHKFVHECSPSPCFHNLPVNASKATPVTKPGHSLMISCENIERCWTYEYPCI